MSEQEQKRLYDHYIAVANNVKKDVKGRDFKSLIRENCAKHAAEILESFPQFAEKEKKEDSKKTKPDKGNTKSLKAGKKGPQGA